MEARSRYSDANVRTATATRPMAMLAARSQRQESGACHWPTVENSKSFDDWMDNKVPPIVKGKPWISYLISEYCPWWMETLGLTFNQTKTADHPTMSNIVPSVHLGRTSRKRRVFIFDPLQATFYRTSLAKLGQYAGLDSGDFFGSFFPWRGEKW